MPAIEERLILAERAMTELGGHAQLPAKIGVHPRQPGSLAHAMPALLEGAETDGLGDLLGVKWIAGFPENPAAGLPTYHAQVILNDARTGLPLAIMDAGAITAQRTAAVSGIAIRTFAPPLTGRKPVVALLGAGIQARGHIPMVALLLPGSMVRVADVDPARAGAVAAAAAAAPGISGATVSPGVRDAVEGADVVISVVSFGPDHQALDAAWLGEASLFVAVDYDMQAPAALARDSMFVVDERDQFLATRAGGGFAGYPDPDATLGEALRGKIARPAGRVLVSHLGVGLADVIFASAILGRAERLGLGSLLPR
jgi:ornithine cyclodeaminase/alanine dehydrogenase-like protein (mu-crystallin family)